MYGNPWILGARLGVFQRTSHLELIDYIGIIRKVKVQKTMLIPFSKKQGIIAIRIIQAGSKLF